MLPPIPEINGRKPRIAVAMSGGVDSSMVAVLLSQAGYTDLVGLTAWTLDGPGKCCNDALINAGRVCETLGMPYDTVDLRAEFAHFVMDYYTDAYKDGLTPNPCVECNRYVKWEQLVAYARRELGVDYVATGHYARIDHLPTGPSRVFRGSDPAKDQTYMLARVKPVDLKYTLFPLAHYQKPELVALAREMDIPTAYSKESQDVCFILDGQKNYLGAVLGKRTGPIIDIETGVILGEHEGHFLYTLGQRKGVGIAAGRPVYVVKLDPEANAVYVGDAQHLLQESFIATDVSWIPPPANMAPDGGFRAMVKIRYNTPPSMAWCEPMGDTDIRITFDEPVPAVTPGQIAAFYDPTDTELWGGAYITRRLPQQPFVPGRKLPTFDEACSVFRP